MMDPANLENLCRICLHTLPKKRKECYTFDEPLEKYADTTFAEAFLSCTGCNIQENEPQRMCLACGTELMLAFDLRVKCYQTQEVLDKFFENGSAEEIDDAYEETTTLLPSYEEYGQEIIEEGEIEFVPDVKPKKIVHKPRRKANVVEIVVSNIACEYCSYKFTSQNALILHMEMRHADQKFECPHCRLLFFGSTIEAHLKECSMPVAKEAKRKRTPKGTSTRREVCPVCAEIRSPYHIRWHIERSQQIDAEGNVITHPYICDICGARKTAKTYILQHIRNEHLNKFVKCRYCPAEFKHPSTLYSHERREHTDKCPLLKCKYCDFMSATHSSLRVHTYSKHTGERKHECTICFARFVTKWKLQEHMGSHTTETPFSCDVCNGKFKTKEGVRRHQTKVHGIYKQKR